MTVFSYRQPSHRGEGAPKGRIGHRRHEREWGNASQVRCLREHPIHRSAVPLPRWGRLRGATLRADFYKGRCPKVVGIAIRGKRIFNIRGGANPVSLRSTAPSRGRGENVGRFECIYPSFLWKEVPAGRRLGAQSGVTDDADGKTFLHKSRLTRVPYPPLTRSPVNST